MKIEKYNFEEIERIKELPDCGRVFRYTGEPLVVAELKENLPEPLSEADLKKLRELYDCRYLLLVADNQDEVQLSCYSETREIRALEFLDSLIPEFGLAKGGTEFAKGQISTVILGIKMAAAEVSGVTEYFLKKVAEYFMECDHIEAKEYGENCKDEITGLGRYVKRREGWAFVKSLDVAEKGQQLQVKTLENESGILLTADEDAYIMIGCRGEIYDIRRQKFETTYEATEESLDVFERMLDFIPAVENVATGEYISLDNLAHICYPKQGAGIYAKKLERRTKIFPEGSSRDYFYGRPGDYMAVRVDDLCDSYIIQGDVFEQTYELAQTDKEAE